MVLMINGLLIVKFDNDKLTTSCTVFGGGAGSVFVLHGCGLVVASVLPIDYIVIFNFGNPLAGLTIQS